jgi:hypothetical protein
MAEDCAKHTFPFLLTVNTPGRNSGLALSLFRCRPTVLSYVALFTKRKYEILWLSYGIIKFLLNLARYYVRNFRTVLFKFITAVTMKNAVFWDIRTQFIPHRKHITCPLQSLAG